MIIYYVRFFLVLALMALHPITLVWIGHNFSYALSWPVSFVEFIVFMFLVNYLVEWGEPKKDQDK